MEGHIRKRGKRYYYSFEVAGVGGKRKRIERAGGWTRKEAEAALREALTEYRNTGSMFEPTRMSFADYLDYWYQNYVQINLAVNTQAAYKNIIEKHLKPALGKYYLHDLSSATLQEFVNHKYLSGISKNHLTNILAVLTGSLKAAANSFEFIKEHPAEFIKIPTYKYTKASADRYVIRPEQFERIIERFPVGNNSYILLMIGYYAGLRIGEITGLTWEDIDFNENTLTVNKQLYKRGKGHWCLGPTKTPASMRIIPFGQTLAEALKSVKVWQEEQRKKYSVYYQQQYCLTEQSRNETINHIYTFPVHAAPAGSQYNTVDFVCTKENGEIMTSNSVKYTSRVINNILLIPFNFHSLRHSHATLLIENGANMKDVQHRMGHSRISQTMDTYAHVTPPMQQQSVDIFENATKNFLRQEVTVGIQLEKS